MTRWLKRRSAGNCASKSAARGIKFETSTSRQPLSSLQPRDLCKNSNYVKTAGIHTRLTPPGHSVSKFCWNFLRVEQATIGPEIAAHRTGAITTAAKLAEARVTHLEGNAP